MTAETRAQTADYQVGSERWNGLSELVASARAEGVEVSSPESIDLARLTPTDALLIVYPRRALPKADLAAFMYDGGRLAVADDFGASSSVLEAFEIGRNAPAQEGLNRLRENRNVLIATPEGTHPLTEGVRALVTNHPRVLHHRELDAVFSLGDEDGAVVLTGAVGKGRLVAISDPSILINNMLEFRDNRAFASNLVRYLAQNRRLWLAGPDTTLTGHYGTPSERDPLGALRIALQDLAGVKLPPSALRFMTAAMAALLLLFAATSLPRRESLARAVTLTAPETLAGFAGRVRFFARPGRNLLAPLLAYKLDFDQRLEAALSAPHEPGRSDADRICAALQRKGSSPKELRRAQRLLRELAWLAQSVDPHSEPQRVSRRKFHALVAAGDRILAALEPRGR